MTPFEIMSSKIRLMEAELLPWIREQHEQKFEIKKSLIQKKALELLPNENFKASRGWVRRFLQRNKSIGRMVK